MASPSSKEEKLEHFHDTLAIITQLGQPDYLVSFYCNENWKEITADLRPGQTPADRPDILCKVFHSKYKDLLEDIKKNHCLGGGSNVAYFSEIEFVTNKGNPTAHIFVILDEKNNKPRDPSSVDSMVCAEIPDEKSNPRLHELVSRWMVHGPCGLLGANNNSEACITNQAVGCKYGYPKTFVEKTEILRTAPPAYRRRKNGFTMMKNDKLIDNSWIIPYNPALLLKYETRLSIEVCTFTNALYYIENFVETGTKTRSFLLP